MMTLTALVALLSYMSYPRPRHICGKEEDSMQQTPWHQMSEEQKRSFVEESVTKGYSTGKMASICGDITHNVIIGFARRRGILLLPKRVNGRFVRKNTQASDIHNTRQKRPWRNVTWYMKSHLSHHAPDHVAQKSVSVPSEHSAYWDKFGIDRNTTCVEDGCENLVVRGKSYCRTHCEEYYIPPKKTTVPSISR